MKICKHKDCNRNIHGKGYCTKHYQRFNKFGSSNIVKAIIRGSRHNHPLDNVYYNMIARCYNPKNKRYRNYGGRGIKVCDRWYCENGFLNFASDLGIRPENKTLDRIDVNGDYTPENVRWADKYTQASNTQNGNIYPGVGWHKQRSKYRARIKINGKEVSLGSYNNLDDAIHARKEAEKKLCM